MATAETKPPRAPVEKARLTKRLVESLKPPASSYELHYDSDVPGLYVRVQASGVKAYEIHKRTKAGVLKRKLGRHPEITPERARQDALDLLAKARLGELPEPARKAVEPEAETDTDPQTLGELWAWHVREIQPGLSPKSCQSYGSLYKLHLAVMANKRLVDFNRPMIESWHREGTRATKTEKRKRGGPYAANHAAVLLKLLLSCAERNGWLASNPARGIRRNREQSRENYLSANAIDSVLAILRAGGSVADKALELAIWTGARKGELLTMLWSDVHGNVWTKPAHATKSGRVHRVPLSPEAQELLRSVPPTGPRVFDVSSSKLDRRWYAVRRAAGVDHARIHDLRHSHAKMLVDGGAHLMVIRDLLGHSSVAVTQKYAHADESLTRAATEQLGKVIGSTRRAAEPVVIEGQFTVIKSEPESKRSA